MVQNNQNTVTANISKDNLPTYLAGLSTDARRIWMGYIRMQLASGDLTTITERLKDRYPKAAYKNVQAVMLGHSYNQDYGPLVVEIALDLIKDRKEEVAQANTNAAEFFANFAAFNA